MNNEEQKIKPIPRRLSARGWIAIALLVVAIGAAILAYFLVTDKRVEIENSTIEAPEINLAPTEGGTLLNMYVKSGDAVTANEVVARVGDELVETKIAGIVTMANADLGAQYAPGQTVVAMIDPTQLRVVGQIDENKGLDRIAVGQYVVFTADAFGSEEFEGIVDEVSPEAQAADIVFQISDKREEQIFDVKVRFDTNEYPELKNGMSAKMWVYTK